MTQNDFTTMLLEASIQYEEAKKTFARLSQSIDELKEEFQKLEDDNVDEPILFI